MAGLITHYICANAVLSKIDKDASAIIEKNRNLYNIGAQGPDIFFYYLPGLLKKGLRGLGSKMHKGHMKTFLAEMCGEYKRADEAARRELFAYLCGYLTHYALDCAVHPYIYYKSGFRKKGEPIRGIRHSVWHRSIETNIDVIMLKIFSGEKPAQKRLWQMLRTKRGDALNVADALSRSINKCYNVQTTPKNVLYAFSSMSWITRLLQSAKGRRKRLLELIETASVGEHIVSSLIHPQFADERYDFLNAAKAEWALPWDKNAKRDDSFAEMFEKAVKQAAVMVDCFAAFAAGRVPAETLLDTVGDRSFASGVTASENVEFKYYDVIFKEKKS